MIHHIVMWKFDASYSVEEKTKLINDFRTKLNGLSGKIAVLNSISTKVNSPAASQTNFDLMLDTCFDTLEGLSAYQVHPEHQKVVEYTKSLKLQRACIDFETDEY